MDTGSVLDIWTVRLGVPGDTYGDTSIKYAEIVHTEFT
jgi:hypothetical protein